MEKIEQYKQLIISILQDYIDYWQPSAFPLEYQLIADEKRHHYQIVCLGWYGEKFTHFTVFHLDIINEKIWIQENRTDILIAQELVKKGIPKSDIVLGLQNPILRQYTEYAVS